MAARPIRLWAALSPSAVRTDRIRAGVMCKPVMAPLTPQIAATVDQRRDYQVRDF